MVDRDRESIHVTGVGEVREPGRDTEFVMSDTKMVHRRPERSGGKDGYKLDPICGQKMGHQSVWSGVVGDSPEEVARKYNCKFCTTCFTKSLQLSRLSRRTR